MKNLILVALVAFVSWQALAVGTCNQKTGAGIQAKPKWDAALPATAQSVKAPPVLAPGVAAAGGADNKARN